MSDVCSKKQQEKWVEEQYKKLICGLCHWPLYPPMQLDCCGERLCEECTSLTKDADFRCPNCSISHPNIILDRGFIREVENLTVTCLECGGSWIGLFKKLREHLKSHCTLICENCDEEFVSAIQLEAHQRKRCKCRIAPCPLSFAGCSNEVAHSEIGKHSLEPRHQQCLVSIVKHLLKTRSNSSSQNLVSEYDQRIATECLPRIEFGLREIDSANTDRVELSSRRQLTEAKIMEVREQLKKMNKDSLSIVKHIASFDKMLMDMDKQTDEIKSQSVTGPSLMNADDTYTLKVNLLFILTDDSHTVHSDSFQSSQWGYRMGISMAIETDAQSKQRFIQVSFIIFRGEYDSILHWNFSYPVTFCLVDLTGSHQHILHSIRPDSRTAIFGKPLNDANTPYRIPQFCPIERLLENGSNYVRDNHIFLQIHIDFTETGVHPFQPKEPLDSSKS